MLPFYSLLSVFAMHFIFDFMAQNQWMIANKNRNFTGLSFHVIVYAIGLFLISLTIPTFTVPGSAMIWIAFNAMMHGITDYVTSRFITSNGSHNPNVATMFNIVGADQLVHYITLFASLYYLTLP